MFLVVSGEKKSALDLRTSGHPNPQITNIKSSTGGGGVQIQGIKAFFQISRKEPSAPVLQGCFYENVCVQDAPVNKVHECECC